MNDKLVLAGIAGFIIGWALQWVIDVYFYRPRMGAQPTPAAAPVGLMSNPEGNAEEIERLKNEIAQRDEELRRLRQASPKTAKTTDTDDLELIDGIGPVFENKLNDAGIKTFAELAQTNADRLREIINPQKWQKIEPEKWIAEAAERAKGG